MLRSEWSVGRGESPSFHQALLMVDPSSNHTNILGTQLGTSANLGDHTKSIATNHNYNCSQRHPLAQIGVNGSLEKCGRNHPIQVAGRKAITPATSHAQMEVAGRKAITPTTGHAQMLQPRHTPVHMTPVTMNAAISGENSVVRPRKKALLLIPRSLIPTNRNKITLQLAREHWIYANHFDKNLPKDNPQENDLLIFMKKLLSILDHAYARIHDRLLEYLQSLAREHNLSATYFDTHSAKNIESIHKAVLSSSDRYNDRYLKMVLEFLKLPQKQEGGWLRLAMDDITSQFDIGFEWGKQNFVQALARETFNNTHNQRIRRGMQRTGVVWYDRVPDERRRSTIFGNANTETIQKQVWFGHKVVHGYLVRKVSEKKQLFPTEWEQEYLRPESDAAFGLCARDAWRDIHGREASLT